MKVITHIPLFSQPAMSKASQVHTNDLIIRQKRANALLETELNEINTMLEKLMKQFGASSTEQLCDYFRNHVHQIKRQISQSEANERKIKQLQDIVKYEVQRKQKLQKLSTHQEIISDSLHGTGSVQQSQISSEYTRQLIQIRSEIQKNWQTIQELRKEVEKRIQIIGE
ncbi:Hypothetical_protein [Hexamita inflata]|uniref:Hypothetical_protein n=1 Tax=Hexamita inflata TaxID=28002 RepID=A0AA86QEI6_9EUKA|nr:Hypothetical protein HINF_LOCUS39204 [Hexamita inflata]